MFMERPNILAMVPPEHPNQIGYFPSGNASITSGIAAALTIAIFFVVFLLTFCCRLITGHRRRREGGRGQLANNHPPDGDDFAAREFPLKRD